MVVVVMVVVGWLVYNVVVKCHTNVTGYMKRDYLG